MDYAVEDITVEHTGVDTKGTQEGGSNIIKNQVHLSRLRDGVFPQEIQVVFENGIVEVVEWDGEAEKHTITLERPAAIEEVFLDPENKIWLDINQLNNRKRTAPETKFARLQLMNFTVWFQKLISIAGAVF